jgi:HAD superfamily hydrolase (TIGR01509 family)
MSAAGVSLAVIVQPTQPYLHDHSYVSDAIEAHPGKFIGVALANPSLSPEAACAELRRLVRTEGYRGVRFNPYIWPAGSRMDGAVGRALYREAGLLGVPVQLMCFRGLPLHLPEIRSLLASSPRTLCVLDHLGFAPPGDPAWASLLDLAADPAVFVKLSALYRTSAEPAPFRDLLPHARDLRDKVGADRLLWGTDFPFAQRHPEIPSAPGYQASWDAADVLLGDFSAAERAEVLGGTALRLHGLPRPGSERRAILWDVDGTLADSWRLGFEASREVLAGHPGRTEPLSEEEYHECTRYCTPDRLARHVGLLPGDPAHAAEGERLGRAFDDLYIARVSATTAAFYDGVAPLLSELGGAVPMAALTNAARGYAEAVFEANGCRGRFGSVHGADSAPKPKPAPDGLVQCCAELGREPADCVYVGDSPSDAEAARRAGMRSVGVTWGSHAEDKVRDAFDETVGSVRELRRTLLGFLAA